MQQYDLVALRSFVTVVEARSFNRAAEQLEASTASVSRRISGLEEALGVKLLNRTTRKIDLTEAGKQYYLDVIEIIRSIEEAEERVRTGTENIRGQLRLAAPLSFGVQCIAPILPGFMQQHPDLRVQMQLEDHYTDLVSEGIDLAVRIGFLKDSTLVATRIGSISRVVCASPDYLVRQGEPTKPQELKEHRCLHYSLLSAREEWGFAVDGAIQEIEIDGALSSNNGEVLREAAIQGMGIIQLPTFIVDDALADGRLKAILSNDSPEPFGLYAVRPSRQYTPARVRRLIEYLKEQLKEY